MKNTNLKVLCVSGKAQHGKDTTANYIKQIMEENGKRVLIAHYADLLKYICKTFFGWDGQKDEKGRSLLQYVGTGVVRKENPDMWVNFIIDMCRYFGDNWDYVVIPDCRFPNELNRFHEEGFNTRLIRINRPNFDNGLTEEQKQHASETAMDDFKPDVLFVNDGTLEDLYEKVEKWSKEELTHE